MSIPAFWNAGWTPALMNHLWQSTAVAGAAWLLAWALNKNHARVRYWVWFAASVKFLLPFSLLVTAGEWLQSLVARPIVALSSVSATVQQVTQPFAQGQMFQGVEPPVAAHRADWLSLALLAIWACGALIVAARFARGWWLALEAKRAARPLALAADVPVLSAEASIEPGVFGIFLPVLLLPEGILERLTAEQMKAIVAHEMCHVRRRDNLTYAIHMVVESLFWFHPAVWWIGARLIDERERACDEAVVQAGGVAQVYAEGILNVCKFYVESPVACVAGVTGADLKKRLAHIMAGQSRFRLTWRKKLLLGAVALTILTLPMFIGLAQSGAGMPGWQKAAGSNMAFEAASIHPAKPGTFMPPNFGLNNDSTSIPPGGRFFADFPLETFIEFAYKIMLTPEQQDTMLAGLPNWVRTEHFVIQAEAPGNPTKDQMRLMVQSLLADRFHLKVHFEAPTEPVLALVTLKRGKLGPRIQPHSRGLPCDAKWTSPTDRTSPTVPPGGFMPVCGSIQAIQGQNQTAILGARNVTLEQIADSLSGISHFGRPIVDGTGLSGHFDFSFGWVPELSGFPASVANTQLDAAGPGLIEALREQFGMKLKSMRAPVRTLVIDHVEQPSPN